MGTVIAIGAGAIQLGLVVVMFVAAGLASDWTFRRTGRRWLARLSAVLVFVLLGVVLWQALNAIMEAGCVAADDFEACMDGGDDRDFM